MKQPNLICGTEGIKININDSFEVKYWANKFGVTRDELRSAVRVVGDSPSKVQSQLKSTPKLDN